MKSEVKNIIENNIDHIDANEFTPPFDAALKLSVPADLLDAFYAAGVAVPTEQLFTALVGHYLVDSTALTAKEKSEKAILMQYLINRYQISIFESMLKSK